MTWNDIATQIIEILISAVITIIGTFVSVFIHKLINKLNESIKSDNIENAMKRIDAIISQCVDTTTQTIVSSKKQGNEFTTADQKIAFDNTLANILSIVTTEDMNILSSCTGDVNKWLTTKIEAKILNDKKSEGGAEEDGE